MTQKHPTVRGTGPLPSLDGQCEGYWETVIHTMMDGLMVVDPRGTIVAVNPAMEGLTGYSREELLGQPCTILDCDRCRGFLCHHYTRTHTLPSNPYSGYHTHPLPLQPAPQLPLSPG